MSKTGSNAVVTVVIGAVLLAAGAGPDRPPRDARAATVDFERDVRPLLEDRCVDCHAFGVAKGGFSLETRQSMLAHGSAVVPGSPEASRLITLVRGDDPDLVMPPKGERLATEQVASLAAWIEQGAAWPAGFAFREAAEGPPSVLPRRPELPPPGRSGDHPIDRILDAYAADHGVELAPPVDDAAFLRRATLDLVGLLPAPGAVHAFGDDVSSDRRERLVRELLADADAYATHWLTFWNDLLRNDYEGTGYIDGGRDQITTWLYAALRDNIPYDRFVTALVAPSPASAGFANGIVWRGEFNVSQSPELQFSQNVAQVFLGVNMKCASCHDSFVDHWTLRDAYGLAAIHAGGPLELHRCDVPTGELARPAFPFPEVGDVDPDAPREERLAQLAALMTSPANGRLTRTIVNRIWTQLMGRGIIEPVDSMDHEPWCGDLLDHLAVHLADHGFDLKATIAHIATSRAYARRPVAVADGAPFVFRGPTPRRLTAEQLLDAVWSVTGSGPAVPSAAVPGDHRSGHWIWSDATASSGRPPGETILLRRRLTLERRPRQAAIVVTVDNEYALRVNGREIAADADWPTPERVDLTSALRPGENEILLTARNHGSADNPAGAFVELVLRDQDGAVHTVPADARWEWSPADAAAGWAPAAVLEQQGFLGAAVNQRIDALLAALHDDKGPPVRASLVRADPLMRALGRPNREQVVSRRPDRLTTVQALHLTNGPEIALHLRQGANSLAERHADPRDIVEDLYLRLLSRQPTAAELVMAAELAAAGPHGVEDLLWALLMLPEFQLVP